MTEKLGRADFHVHYKPWRPETAFAAIDMAKENNIVVLGLLARGEVAKDFNSYVHYGRKRGIKVIAGTEVVTQINGQSVDIICLTPKQNHPAFRKLFDPRVLREHNKKVAQAQSEFLELEALVIDPINEADEKTLDRVMSGRSLEKAIYLCRVVAANPINQEIIEAMKKEDSGLWQRVYDKYHWRPDYQKQEYLEAKFLYQLLFAIGGRGHDAVNQQIGGGLHNSIEEVLEKVHKSGGVVLWSPEGNYNEALLKCLLDKGIDGIMGWHATELGCNGNEIDIPIAQIKRLRKMGKLVLGGSDYQGGDFQLGTGKDDRMYISHRRRKDLEDYWNQIA